MMHVASVLHIQKCPRRTRGREFESTTAEQRIHATTVVISDVALLVIRVYVCACSCTRVYVQCRHLRYVHASSVCLFLPQLSIFLDVITWETSLSAAFKSIFLSLSNTYIVAPTNFIQFPQRNSHDYSLIFLRRFPCKMGAIEGDRQLEL